MDRIVEYATREQAQNAVNTLSNQNLMGRLVYVREVRPSTVACLSRTCESLLISWLMEYHRIERPNLALLVPHLPIVVASAVLVVVVDLAVPGEQEAVVGDEI